MCLLRQEDVDKLQEGVELAIQHKLLPHVKRQRWFHDMEQVSKMVIVCSKCGIALGEEHDMAWGHGKYEIPPLV